MVQVIPTIIAQNYQEIEEKINQIQEYVNWAQLDIMDGKFVANSTWPYSFGEIKELKNLKTDLKLEAHLMVEQPEEIIDEWIDLGINRLIFHYESTQQHLEIIQKIKEAGLKAGLAINPKTPLELIDNLISKLDLVLIMTVNPGKGGQKLIPETISKIKSLREKHSEINIEVDGGINLETAKQVIQAGANLLASGSAIFNSQNIKETIKQMQNI